VRGLMFFPDGEELILPFEWWFQLGAFADWVN
jgi:hypothetical protein